MSGEWDGSWYRGDGADLLANVHPIRRLINAAAANEPVVILGGDLYDYDPTTGVEVSISWDFDGHESLTVTGPSATR